MTVPVRASSVRIARLDGDGAWQTVGGATAMTMVPAIEAAADAFAGLNRMSLEAAAITVAFHPSRAMVRLLFGWSATVDRSRVRSATRRRYRARARRGRA